MEDLVARSGQFAADNTASMHSPQGLPSEVKQNPRVVVEEGAERYCPGDFHPVYVGDIYNGRYEVLNKIGYGMYSTVWLVRDLQNDGTPQTTYKALKILSAFCYNQGHDTFEKEILLHLREGDQGHAGYALINHLLDDFLHEGPNGTHADNIFLKFRDYSLIENGFLTEVPIPKQDRTEEQYTVVPSYALHNYYFTKDDIENLGEFDIVLGDWGVSSWKTKHLCELIQPVLLRSPEVLIGAPWDEKTDFWNLGAVLLEIFRTIMMFTGEAPPDGHYELREHLAEIVGLFGPFPKTLLDRGDQELVQDMFDDKGYVKNAALGPMSGLEAEGRTPGLSPDLREVFVSFLRAIMVIDPEQRPEPIELLMHPWLHAIRPDAENSQRVTDGSDEDGEDGDCTESDINVPQSAFAPNPEWSDRFSPGAELRNYWQGVTQEYDVSVIKRTNSGGTLPGKADVVLSAVRNGTSGFQLAAPVQEMIGLRGVATLPAWLVLRHFGVKRKRTAFGTFEASHDDGLDADSDVLTDYKQ
ncbi:hypothetical protein S40288_07043 [Stachybotrys chartarum IBT 40288]|nr:hypothetical protein S40288_07043 [Stachybotrys chartarum IBT 40288]